MWEWRSWVRVERWSDTEGASWLEEWNKARHHPVTGMMTRHCPSWLAQPCGSQQRQDDSKAVKSKQGG
jgi:hypothetical protein